MLTAAIDLVCKGDVTQLLVPVKIPSPDDDDCCSSTFVAVVLHSKKEINVVKLAVKIHYRQITTRYSLMKEEEVFQDMKKAHVDMEFISVPLTSKEITSILWDVLDEHAKTTLNGVRHRSVNEMVFCVAGPYGTVELPAPENERIERAFYEICSGSGPSSASLLIPYRGTFCLWGKVQYMSFTRVGLQVKVAICKLEFEDGARIVTFKTPTVLCHLSDIRQQYYPGFRFSNDCLSKSEMNSTFIQPVVKHYSRIIDGFGRRTALAMALHPILGNRAAISCLDSDQLEFIARLSVD